MDSCRLFQARAFGFGLVAFDGHRLGGIGSGLTGMGVGGLELVTDAAGLVLEPDEILLKAGAFGRRRVAIPGGRFGDVANGVKLAARTFGIGPGHLDGGFSQVRRFGGLVLPIDVPEI